MKIIYVGSLESGEVQAGEQVFKFTKGEPVEVPTDLGEELVKRKDWKAAKTTKAKE